MKKFLTSVLLATALLSPCYANQLDDYEELREAVTKTVRMVNDSAAQQLAARMGLGIVNVTWEDTGRYKGSSVGPNISDMTLQVQMRDPKTDQYSLHCLPVIRHPNFSDETADISPDKFFLLVGNEDGHDKRKVSLRQYLGDLRAYLSKPDSWTGEETSLLADRDSHVLVSAQACFLPVPKGQDVEFNPVLFNYQSMKGDPAVLTILATREGTSATIIDNARDGFAAGRTWGQRLFFNQNGERASLTGTRLSDHLAHTGVSTDRGGRDTVSAAGQEGLNMVLLIQVPLKQKTQVTRGYAVDTDMLACCEAAPCPASSTVENAVIGHGKVEGPYTEIDHLAIERDDRFPIRVTVQFYKATDNGVVSEADLKSVDAQLRKVYEEGDYVGSLVTGGDTGRPTEYDGNKVQPDDWWAKFYDRYVQETGDDWTGLDALWNQLGLRAR